MDKLYIVEYKAFQPIHETNIIGSDPITKKDDKSGVVVTMIKKDYVNGSVGISLIIENPNNIENIITGNLEVPFPSENNVKSQIVKINNVIELVLSVKVLSAQTEPPSKPVAIKPPTENDFITVSRKTFADRVKGESSSPKPTM